MKKFSNIGEVKTPKYEKDTLKNELYSLVEETILLKVNNEDKLDSDVDISGKEELVEKLKKLIEDVRVKERTLTLETVKVNVYRNFDMNWLNEQISSLKKIKVGSDFVLQENISNPETGDQYKADLLKYFVKELNELSFIGSFKFEYEPSEGLFEFKNESNGIVVRATPFYEEKNGIPLEVFKDEESESHEFIKQTKFDTEKLLFDEYLKIMVKFLTHDYMSEWGDKLK